jgi:hypothetical protein
MTNQVDRSALFCDIGLAERIERVEAQLIAASSDAARRRRADTIGAARLNRRRSRRWRRASCCR